MALVAGKSALVTGPRAASSATPVVTRPRLVKAQSAKVAPGFSRRDSLLSGTVLTLLSVTSPAHAFLGFGDDIKALEEAYAKETNNLLSEVKLVLDSGKDAPERDDKIKQLRKDINVWVAKYRREPKISGRPSYGNTYSAFNALAGHYNSFGTQAPIPKKRLERLVKELGDAELLLSRGR